MGSTSPIDTGEVRDLVDNELPAWFDPDKFYKAQKYFKENRFGIIMSSYYGLFCLLSESKGLEVLTQTNNTSTIVNARKRYVSTILNLLSWYEIDFTTDCDPWKSVVRVRRTHLNYSNAMLRSNRGLISQMLVALTGFGFMGFALIKPHQMGVRTDCRDDREGFVHFWAVMLYMLGLDDQFNYCLGRLEVVEQFCSILLRYVFIPLVQLESNEYKKMMGAMLNGVGMFLPNFNFESEIFMARRLFGVPGYQFDLNVMEEGLCRDMYTAEEIDLMKLTARNIPFQLGNLTYCLFYEPRIFYTSNDSIVGWRGSNDRWNSRSNHRNTYDDLNLELLRKYCGLDDDVELTEKVVPSDAWLGHLNDEKFKYLSVKSKICVRIRCIVFKMVQMRVFRPAIEWITDQIITSLHWWRKRNRDNLYINQNFKST